jgi:hypothetical protein
MKPVLIGFFYYLIYPGVLLYLRFTDPNRCRFYRMHGRLKRAMKVGNSDVVRELAGEYLTLAELFPDDWNYGNAIHNANLAFGFMSLQNRDLEMAKQYLLKAGMTPGSPQLNSFGPNMALARQLLFEGEKDVVLQYLQLCRKFWEMEEGLIDYWSELIKQDNIPDFKGNLHY